MVFLVFCGILLETADYILQIIMLSLVLGQGADTDGSLDPFSKVDHHAGGDADDYVNRYKIHRQ